MSTTAVPVSAVSARPQGSLGSLASVRSLRRTLRILITETRFEFLRLLRTRAFSLSVIGFPLMFYTLFGLLLGRGEPTGGGMSAARHLLAGYAVFGAVGAALFGVGVGLAGDVAAGWLELKRASPMPPIALLLAKCLTAIAFGLIIVSLLTGLAIGFGHVPVSLGQYARMLGLTVVGAVPFASLGLVLALLVPANSAPGITNLIYLPMSFLGGLWLPVQALPRMLQAFAPALPTFHVGQLMLSALGYPSAGTPHGHAMYIVGFTLLMLGIASLLFHRRESNA